MSRNNQNFLNFAWPLFKQCQWCLLPLTRAEATADHLIPSSRGGLDRWDNLLVSCYHCNHTRGNRVLLTRKRRWRNNRIPKPHGPIWFGPKRNLLKLRPSRFWCGCHNILRQNMVIKSNVNLDVFDLFLHEKYDCGPLSEQAVASLVSKWVNDRVDGVIVNVLPPSDTGLDRFVLEIDDYKSVTRYVRRFETAGDLKDTILPSVVKALTQMNTAVVSA